MCCVAKKTDAAFGPVRIRLMDIESPHLDIGSVKEESYHTWIEFGIGCCKFFGCSAYVPAIF